MIESTYRPGVPPGVGSGKFRWSLVTADPPRRYLFQLALS
jgi:hypothetical protein